MATVNKQYVFDLMEKEQLPYFTIRDNAGSPRHILQNESEANIAEAVSMMQECFDVLEDNYCHVTLSDRNRVQKGKGGENINYQFKVNLMAGNKAAAIASVRTTNTSDIKYIQEIDALKREIEIMKFNARLEKMQDEMKAMKEGSMVEKLLSNPQIIQGIGGMFGIKTPVALAGSEDGPVDGAPVEKENKIRSALTKLMKIDSDLPETLSKLADYAETNPAQYFTFKKML